MSEPQDITIQLTKDIEKIIKKNLDEKRETFTVKLDSCKECPNYDNPYIRGGKLHCCSYDYENKPTRTSRDANELFEECPLNKELEVTKSYIKKYGIIHNKPNGRYSDIGSIGIVDFSGTTFEWDGYNPDVDWEPVIVFYYNNQEEADYMMDLALDYYNRFNMDSEFVEKHCYG